ncbi:MAG TPA: hydrogenase maturation protease [Acidobacteriaceae bacterium]
MATPAHASEAGRVLILACGNSLRSDDGIGLKIGCAVEDQPPRSNLKVILSQQLLPEHAFDISESDVVVFVDCSAVTAAGVVTTMTIHPAEKLPTILTHHLDPASLMKMAKELYGHMPTHAFAVTVGAGSFDLSEKLTPPVEAAIPAAIEAVRKVLLTP